jgi:hypothetical protein
VFFNLPKALPCWCTHRSHITMLMYPPFSYYHVDAHTVLTLPCWCTHRSHITMLMYTPFSYYHVDVPTVLILPCSCTHRSHITMLMYPPFSYYHVDVPTVLILPFIRPLMLPFVLIWTAWSWDRWVKACWRYIAVSCVFPAINAWLASIFRTK